MNWLTKSVLPKIKALVTQNETKENLWIKCNSCNQMIFHKDLFENLNVCPNCSFHLPINPRQRLNALLDDEKIEEINYILGTQDILKFRDLKKYSDRLKIAQNKTKQNDAMLIAKGKILGIPVVVAVFDFRFMGGSMGQSVGNAIIKASETAVEEKSALITIPSSGGARMQEGIISLMQMPRTVAAIQLLEDSRLPHIVLLTHPTTGGVTASFSMLGDVHIAEPGATIGFAGRRVIEETVKEELPSNFQTADYLKEHGMVDIVASRNEHREVISNLLSIIMNNPKNVN